jgi:hypothetical protein
MRTEVAPSSTATPKASLFLIDSVSRSTVGSSHFKERSPLRAIVRRSTLGRGGAPRSCRAAAGRGDQKGTDARESGSAAVRSG